MKSDITFLSERKQRDLHELVALIREEIRDVVMIILYGSYAKNTYVDLDERHDFGVRTYYMSDYDLLVVTQRRLGVRRRRSTHGSRSVFWMAKASSRPIRSLSTKVSPNSTMRSPRGDTSMSRS